MSDKKTSSNRTNAKKSSGPKSGAGKAVVAQNARKHGLLSRHLIIDGESQEEFDQLLYELTEEFLPVGLVEQALVERVGIAFWRQRRLVQAESANVSLNQQSFGHQQTEEVRKTLNLEYSVSKDIKAPDDSESKYSLADLQQAKDAWQSLLDEGDGISAFANLSASWKKKLLGLFKSTADTIDAVVVQKYGSWDDMIEAYVSHYERLMQQYRIKEISRLVMKSQAIPSQPELLARYQTALDNDLYKALKALRDSQAWRTTKAIIAALPVHAE